MSTPQALAVLAAATSLTVAAAAAYAILSAESQLLGPTLVAPPHPNQLALTFDDGPNPSATPQLLDILARHRVRATFFLIGRFVLHEPALTRRIAAAGHLIGNHTMSHPFLPRLAPACIREQLLACNRALEHTLGTPITLFRPPHGARTPAVLRVAAELGLKTVQWNIIVDDWKPVSAPILLERLETRIARNRRRRRGSNIVLHDGGQHTLGTPRLPTVKAVERLLPRLPGNTAFVTPADWIL